MQPHSVIYNSFISCGFNRYAYCAYNPLKYVDPSGEQYFGWDPGLAYRMEQEARAIVRSFWQQCYDSAMASHYITIAMANSLFSHGQDTKGNGSGNHGSVSGGSQQTPVGNNQGDGSSTNNSNNSNSYWLAGSSPDNPTSSHLLADKCDWWYNYGDNKPMYVKASKFMFWFLSKKDLTNIGENTYTINLFTYPYMFVNPQLAMALGQITLTDMGNNMYHIEDDTYDFNVKKGEYFSNWRNIATSYAGIIHGGINEPTFLLYPATYWGGEFKIHFINNVYIKP